MAQHEAVATGTAATAADLVAAVPQQAAPGVQQAAPAAQHAPALPVVAAAAGEMVAALASRTQTVALPRVTKRPWLLPRSATAAGFEAGAVAVRVAGAAQQHGESPAQATFPGEFVPANANVGDESAGDQQVNEPGDDDWEYLPGPDDLDDLDSDDEEDEP